MTAVTRVLVGASPEGVDRADAGADGQPAETISVPSLADLRDAAQAASAPLLWLLDARAAPAPNALEALLDAGRLPAVSVPVDAAGGAVSRLIGRYVDTDDEMVLEAVQRQQTPLRHTYLVSMLVAREMVLELAPPDPSRFAGYAGVEWAARLLSRHTGVLVPDSRVHMGQVPRPALVPALRLAKTGLWRRREILREVGLSLRGSSGGRA